MTEYRNPQNEPGIQKRLILVFAFTFVILLLSQQFLTKKNPAGPAQPQAPATQQQSAPAAAPATASAAAAPSPAALQTTAKKADSESETVVENDLYRITFTNRGALVKSWILKKYKDEKGNPLELVHPAAATQYGFPLSLWTPDAGLRDRLNTALYVSDAQGAVSAPKTISFEYSEGGLDVKKNFTFDQSYAVKVSTSVQNGGSYVTALPAWPAGFGDAGAPATYASQRIDYDTGSDVKRLKLDKKGKDISGGRLTSNTLQWAGTSDQYFAAIFLPDSPQTAAMAELRNSIDVPKDPAKPQGEKMRVEVLGAAVGTLNAPVSERLFVGPKSIDVLQTVKSASGDDLRPTVDFGMWTFIARPLFVWARWTQEKWIPNWGWTIIFLTIVINAALLPLRLMSMKSALKMQKVSPQIQAIQNKYKQYKLNDPRRAQANQEIAALYKEHNVNPAGGCLPLIIQMPFLFAFYGMLANAIELRQAHWYWLRDLSQPDRWFILPILIILSMVVMQRMTPTAGISAEQQRMMNFMMPVMLGFFSYSVASGLGLYWVTGTIVGIVQQWAMNRTELGREMRATAEKRARKQMLKAKR